MVNKYSASGTHGSEAKQWWRDQRTHDIKALCGEYGMECRQLTPYQIRVAGKVDFYVTNGRAHLLPSNKRIDYHTADDVRQIFEQIQQGKV